MITKDGMNYRTYVANDDFEYGKLVADLMWEQGLREGHTVCDIGAGSLRVGRWLLRNVGKGGYYYIEPNGWLVDQAIEFDGIPPNIKEHGCSARDFDILQCFGKQMDYGLISAVLIHVDHETLQQALLTASAVCKTLIFDTFPQGPDWSGQGWLYPDIAPHYDECVLRVAPEAQKLHVDYRGAQWWRLDS